MRRGLSRAIAASTLAGAACAALGWEDHPPLPLGVGGHAAVSSSEGSLWVLGGSFWEGDAKKVDRTVRRLRSRADKWEMAFDLPRAFAHGGFAANGDTLWLTGGFDEHGPSAATHRIELGTGRVTTTNALPEPRVYCGAAYLDRAVWIVGGTRRDGEFAQLPSSWFRLDAASGVTRTMPSISPATINPVVLPLGGELHVLPGSVWSATQQRLEAPTDVWIYAPRADRWTRRALAQPLPRGLSGVALDSRRALLVGGVESRDGTPEISRHGWIYDAVENTLVPVAPLPEPRLAAAAVAVPGAVWLIGGEARPRSRAATVWRLALPTATAP